MMPADQILVPRSVPDSSCYSLCITARCDPDQAYHLPPTIAEDQCIPSYIFQPQL